MSRCGELIDKGDKAELWIAQSMNSVKAEKVDRFRTSSIRHVAKEI